MDNFSTLKFSNLKKPVKIEAIKQCSWCGRNYYNIDSVVNSDTSHVKDGMLWFDCSCSSRLFMHITDY